MSGGVEFGVNSQSKFLINYPEPTDPVDIEHLQKQRSEEAIKYEKRELDAGRKPNPLLTARIQAGEKLYPHFDADMWLRSCQQEVEQPLPGRVTGSIPDWVDGTFLMNGPGTLGFGNDVYKHVFDGSAMIQSYQFKDGKATYQSRFVKTNSYMKNRAANRIAVSEFGTVAAPDPCQTIFQRVTAVFRRRQRSDNTLISLYPIGDGLYAFSETPYMTRVNPITLEREDRVNLHKSLGIVHHTSHPIVFGDGSVVNIGLRKGSGGMHYVLIQFPKEENGGEDGEVSAGQSGRVCCSVPARWSLHPSYMHSFGATATYWIIAEQPLTISVPAAIRAEFFGGSSTAVMRWFPEYKTVIHLVNRSTGERTHSFEVQDPMFYFHIINCFERPSEDGGDPKEVVFDVCTYDDPEVINTMYVAHLKDAQRDPDYGRMMRARPTRFLLPLDPQEPGAEPRAVEPPTVLCPLSCDAPRLHPKRACLPYRYFYAMTTQLDSPGPAQLVKVDTWNRTHETWGEEGVSPSEPVFIPHPDGQTEDDGVVLSAFVWTAEAKRAGVVVIDARTWKELGRVEFHVPGEATRPFHGWFVHHQS